MHKIPGRLATLTKAAAMTLSLGLALSACGPKPRPKTAINNPPPPPAPVGEQLRLAAKVGQTTQGKVTLRVESDSPGPKNKRVHSVRTYTLNEEQTVTAVDPDGTQQVTGRLRDVDIKSDNPKEARELEGIARALSELKITFKRTALGEVPELTAEPVNKPLDPYTAVVVARSVYGAGRGVLFTDQRKQVGDRWNKHSEVPLPNNAGTNVIDVEYRLEKLEGAVATIAFTGKSQAQAGDVKLTGELSGTLQLDVKTGAYLSQTVETKSVRGEGTPGAATVQVRLEWQAEAPAAVETQATPAQAK